MAGLTTALFWRRLDTAGAEQTVVVEGRGLRARGRVLAATPVPYACRYELVTDDDWATTRCEVTVEGAGFTRSVRLERAAGRWRVTATEQGSLDAALVAARHARVDQPGCEEPGLLSEARDVDLGGSPLTNTLPIRRLRLLAEPGRTHTVDVALVLVPSLEVVPSTQTYRAREDGIVEFTSGSFHAELTVDERGYVRHYPGLAETP
jgi:hypothetical protein